VETTKISCLKSIRTDLDPTVIECKHC